MKLKTAYSKMIAIKQYAVNIPNNDNLDQHTV